MALEHIVAAANDGDLQQRIAACVVQEAGFDDTADPAAWAIENRWAIAKNFGDEFESAAVVFIDRPGLRPSVVSDQAILSAVQARLTELATP